MKKDTQQHEPNFYEHLIGRSRGGMPGARPPLWDPILSFLQTFSPKSAHIGGPCPPNGSTYPPNGSTSPLREILDPPLHLFITKKYVLSTCLQKVELC